MHTGVVQFATEVRLPSLIKRQLHEMGFSAMRHFSYRFNTQVLTMHVKNDGPKLLCAVQLSTDFGQFHAHAADWDVRRAVAGALQNVEHQVIKHVALHHAHQPRGIHV